MFKMTISFKNGEKMEKHSIKDFKTFIDACLYTKEYSDEDIVEVLITRQKG